MKKGRISSFTAQYVIIIGGLLLLTNVILGAVLLFQSTTIIHELVRKNMLNLVVVASEIVNGDEIGALTEESVGGPAFERIHDQLSVFQKNADIEYIYAVRKITEDEFIFTVDADPEAPADFGEEVLVTDALRKAAKGRAAVDDEPAEDEWGNFYSAYSPIYDSKGEIAGIVGIDFNSEWYDRQVREHTVSIGLLTVIFVILGGVLVYFLMRSVRRRFLYLGNQIALLSEDVNELSREITSSSDYQESLKGAEEEKQSDSVLGGDDVEELGGRVKAMHTNLKRYLEFVHAKASTDVLTGVGNTTAFYEVQRQLEERIAQGSARFILTIFDINYLKRVNDMHGHKTGNVIIRGAAQAIEEGFGRDHTFRIGGDEFITVSEQEEASKVEAKIRSVLAAVDRFNQENRGLGAQLSLSFGMAGYEPEKDTSFQEVFVRADEKMYVQKTDYHSKFMG